MKNITTAAIFSFFMLTLHAQTECTHGDCLNGNGTYKWENGDTYTGQWHDGMRSGYGRYDWANGAYYVGDFKNNLLEGEGTYYDENGKVSMKGKFLNNEFQGTVQDNSAYDEADEEDTSSAWLDEWLNDYDEQTAENDNAKAEALKNAKYYDFKTVTEKVIAGFANNFESFKAGEHKSTFDFGGSWYSNILVTGTEDAMVSASFLGSTNSWYNVLYTGQDFNQAKKIYDGYVDQFTNNVRTNCCTLVYDKYDDYKTESYESYGTYWIPFLINDGYSEEVYEDMLVEIEMTSTVLEKGYQILLRVSHLSDSE